MPDANVNVPDVEQYEDEADMGHESDFNPANDVDDLWDVGLNDYESADDSGAKSDGEAGDAVMVACNRYEQNSGGFVFSADGNKIILKPGQLYKDIDEFRTVVKAYAIQNGSGLQRVKNEKARVTLKCAAPGCSWRIHANLNWNKRHFQVKTYFSEHTCERNNDNNEANSTWIAATFLHLVRVNNQVTIDVIAAELFKQYGITCSSTRLYRAKNKALELLRQDHKASFSKLSRYMHAILDSNPGSTVDLDRNYLSGGQ